MCLKTAGFWKTVQTLIWQCILWCLIWVYFVWSGLPVWILTASAVKCCRQKRNKYCMYKPYDLMMMTMMMMITKMIMISNLTTLQPMRVTWIFVLGFNDMSALVGHFVSSPRRREKRDRRDSRGDEGEEQGRKRNRNESEETEEIKTIPLYPYLLQG